MSHINLLPWREQLREKQKKQYLAILLFTAVAAFILMFCAGMVVDRLIENQQKRNQFLEQKITELDSKIEQIRNIREQKQLLEQQIALIEQLQDSKNVAPHILDELTKLVPTGINFVSLKRSNNNIEVLGVSESNNRLSEFMRQLERSQLFINSELSSIVHGTNQSSFGSDFKLTFELSHELVPPLDTVAEKGAG